MQNVCGSDFKIDGAQLATSSIVVGKLEIKRSFASMLSVALALPLITVVIPSSSVGAQDVGTEPDPTIEVSVDITDPLDGDTIDPGAVIEATSSTGVAANGERGLIVVIDVSGSAGWPAGGDCTGDGINDTVLTCEQAAAIEVFERAATTGLIQEVGVVAFAGRGGAGDMSPAAGVQLLTTIDADENGNGLPDYEDVVRSARINSGLQTFSFSSAGAGTNYAGGAQAACTVAAEVSTENPLVVFLSDGDNLLGSDVTSVLPCGSPAEFQTVAVGSGSTCAADPRGRGSLAEVAALTGGACTEVIRPDELPELLADLVAPKLTSVEVTVNGSAPLDISEFTTPALPASAVDIAWPSVGLRPGVNQICFVATVERGDRQNSATDCVDVIVRGGVEANAGDDQTVSEGSVARLDGTESTGSGALTATWTTTEEFETGASVNVDANGDQLALDETQQAFDFIWIAASQRGTVVKIDTRTGDVLGEYWSAPQNRSKDPSRTTVDKGGNVWVGNRAERSAVDGVAKGSVTQIGLAENGQCVDRNGNGTIETSSGLGDILAWPNVDGSDSGGGVGTAVDECVVNYVRTNGAEIRHVSVDPDDHVWVGGPRDGGSPPRYMDRINQQGEIVRSINFSNVADTGEAGAISCCYGGLIDREGIIWTATAIDRRLLRIDPSLPNGHPDLIESISVGRVAYGVGLDPDGDIWLTNWTSGTVQEYSPAGVLKGGPYPSGGSATRGVAATADGDIWVVNSSSNNVVRLAQDGTILARIGVGSQPTGVSVDAAGKVWAANRLSNSVSVIDPATNSVVDTIDLGAGAAPYNYSDMTGSTLGGAAEEGTWSVVHDGGQAGTDWAFVDWASEIIGDGSVEVTIATSDDGVTFGADVPVADEMLLDAVVGQFARITVRLTRSSDGVSPRVFDVSLARPSGAGELSYLWRQVDAVGPPVILTSNTSATPSFVAPDDGTYTFELTVTDEIGSTDTDRVTVVVENLEPVLEVEQGDSYAGSVTQITAKFTDPGWLDTHSAEINWGDGTVSPIPVTAQGSGWGSFFGSHVYQDPGTYDVNVVLTDDDGGTATATIGQLSVAEPIALWANSSTAPETLRWTSGTSTVDGTVHSNGSLHIGGKGKTVEGEVRYVTELSGNLQQHEFAQLPTQTTVQEPPLTYDIADYRPGGPVSLELGDNYVDVTSECASGVWQQTQTILAAAVYYADCDVKLNGSQIGGLATVVAEGTIHVSGSSPAFQPFYDGLLFLSGAAGNGAIKLSSSNSKYLGVVYAQFGDLEISGSDSTFYCGMFGDTVSLTGADLYLRGATCGRPDDTVAGPLLVPNLSLDLTADREVAAPADTINYQLTVTNDGALVLVPGLYGIENIGESPVTLSGFEFAVQRLDTTTGWETVVSTADGFELDIRENETPGVVYGTDGPVGTVIDPGALATWGFQGVVEFDAAATAALLDPAHTAGIRVLVTPTHDPISGLIRPLYRFGSNFIEELRALGGDISAVDATLLLPGGDALVLDAGAVPEFSLLAPEQSATTGVTFEVPVPSPRAATESDDGYLARLLNLDGAQLVGAAFVRATGGVGQIVAPVSVVRTTETLPVVSVVNDGPTSLQAGSSATYDATISNVGSADTPSTVVIGTADGAELVVTGAPPALIAGQITTGTTTTYDTPADQSGPVDVRVEATWTGANGVTYGPVGSDVRVDVREPASLAASMTAVLLNDADGDGFVSPGDTLRYLGTVSNSGGVPLSGVAIDVTPDANTQLLVGSVTTETGTVITGNAAGDTLVSIGGGMVGARSSVDFSFDVTLADPWPADARAVEATGVVSADGFGPIPTDDPNSSGDGDATRTQVIVPFANAYVTLLGRLAIDRDGDGVASAGDRLEYELEVQSTGSRPITDATVTVPVPVPGSLVTGSVTTTQGVIVPGTDVVVEIGDLNTLDTYLATITFAVDMADDIAIAVDYGLQGVLTSPDVADIVSDDLATSEPGDPTLIIVRAPNSGGGGSGGGGSGGGGSGGGTGGGGGVGNGLPGPSVEELSVVEGGKVTVPTEISTVITPTEGTQIASWEVSYQRLGSDATGVLASDPAPAAGPVRIGATFDPTVLPNGTYEIVITTIGSDGGATQQFTNVRVEGDFKPGRFEISFDDLTVQFPGLPIRVLRNYDSFDTASGDFGRGWSLDNTRVGLATTSNLSSGWFTELGSCSFIFCSVNVLTNDVKNLYVTWPDGKIDTFTLKVNPYQSLFPGFTTMYLEADDENRAEAELVSNSAYYIGGQLRQGLFGIDGDISIDQLILNVAGGSSYRISKSGGLISATSPSGEVLSYTTNGVTSDINGPVVQYVRNANGRIDQVVGPNGAAIDYAYNANNELVSVTNAAGETTGYTYLNGVLQEVLDAYGAPMRRINYDAAGRVESITDANGNTVQITSDIDGRQQIITDAEGGYTTITKFDEAGDIVRIDEVYDGETQTTTMEYDDRGLMIRRVDPLGNEWLTDYNASGDPTLFTGPDGATVTYTYNRPRLPATVTDQEGQVTTFEYLDNGQPRRVIDHLGNALVFDYDARGKLTKHTDREGNVTEWTYDSGGRIAAVTEGGPDNPGTVQFTYNALGHPTSVTRPGGGVTTMAYDAVGNLLTMTDPLVHVTGWDYDLNGRLIEQTQADGNATTFDYDDGGRLETATDVLGFATSYAYDLNDRVVAKTDPGDLTTMYERDGAGRVIGEINALGDRTTFEYDALSRTIAVIDPLDRRAEATYDEYGRSLTRRSPTGATWSYEYDGAGRPIVATNPLGDRVEREYDDLGRLVVLTDRRDQDTTFTYDRNGLLDTMTDSLGGMVDYDYDAIGHVTAVTDPIGLTREYSYDNDGNLVTSASSAQGVTTYDYDLLGQPVSMVDGRGVAVGIAYDPMGRIAALSTPVGTISHVYDEIGRRTSMTDLVGTTTWSFDDEFPNLVASVTSQDGTVGYDYDAVGRRASMSQPEGTVEYEYDSAGQLISLLDWSGAESTFGYTDDGLLESISRPNGVDTSFGYDGALRVDLMEHSGPGGVIEYFDYTLDANGNRVAVDSSAGNESYTLDELSRLTEVRYPDGEIVTYSYDAGGNRLTEITGADSKTYVYNEKGQLVSDGEQSFDYDDAGNMTAAGADAYEWDWAGRLSSATVDGESTEYDYDGDGVRVSAVDSTGTTSFVWDRESGLPMLVSDGDAGYLQLGGHPFASGGATDVSFQLTDALGSVRATTNAAGAVTSSTSYDVWGATRSGSTATFGFAGEQLDTTGLIHLRARQYNPELGRFLSADTVQPNAYGSQGWNLYSYAAGNPTTLIDPSGNVSLVETAVIGAAVGGTLGLAFGLLTCRGQGNYAACVLREGIIGAIGGIIAALLGAWAFGALVSGGWGAVGAFLTAEFLAAAAESIVAQLLRGEFDPLQALIDGLIGAVSAGVLNSGAASKLMDQLGDLFSGLNRACSFSAETEVLMADGSSQPISEISIGDWVMAHEPETGRGGAREVTATWLHEDTLIDLAIGDGVVTTTRDHPFWNDSDSEWQRADSLGSGDLVFAADGERHEVRGLVDQSAHVGDAYNLTVENLHTFYVFVGADTALVHNVCNISPGEVPKPPRGPGSVPADERDPTRLFPRDEVADGLQEQGGQCLQCGDPLDLGDAKGHHVERHADGGATDPDNLAVLCGPCHTEVHRP